MEFVIGLLLAIIVALMAFVLQYDRDRSFYPTILMVIALGYVLFGVLSGSLETTIIESLIALVFIGIAIYGSRTTRRIVAVGIILHGLFDIVHAEFITNTGVPDWWYGACMTFDIVLGMWLLVLDSVTDRGKFVVDKVDSGR